MASPDIKQIGPKSDSSVVNDKNSISQKNEYIRKYEQIIVWAKDKWPGNNVQELKGLLERSGIKDLKQAQVALLGYSKIKEILISSGMTAQEAEKFLSKSVVTVTVAEEPLCPDRYDVTFAFNKPGFETLNFKNVIATNIDKLINEKMQPILAKLKSSRGDDSTQGSGIGQTVVADNKSLSGGQNGTTDYLMYGGPGLAWLTGLQMIEDAQEKLVEMFLPTDKEIQNKKDNDKKFEEKIDNKKIEKKLMTRKQNKKDANEKSVERKENAKSVKTCTKDKKGA